jgi:tetratricopeptide (TPR) repeat protein
VTTQFDIPDYAQRIGELVQQALELEHGPAQIALLEEAVRLADAHDDLDLGYDIRQELIDAATFGGSPDVALVAFAWCVARSDEDPDRFDVEVLYWKYKWIATAAAMFPTIPRPHIEQLLDEMLQRYQAAGISRHAFYQTRRNVYLIMGELEAAAQDHQQVQQLQQDYMSDCPACEQDSSVDLYLYQKDYTRAFQTAQPILRQKSRCAEVPHRTYARLVIPALRHDNPELAISCYRKGLKLIKTNPSFLREASCHLLFLNLTDNMEAAVRLAQRYLPLYVASRCPLWRFNFSRSMAFTCQRLAAMVDPPTLRLPNNFPLDKPMVPHDYAALAKHFAGEAQQLASVFDTRNGNDFYQRQLAECDQWWQWIRPLSLKG